MYGKSKLHPQNFTLQLKSSRVKSNWWRKGRNEGEGRSERERKSEPGRANARTKLPKVLPQTNKHIYIFKLKKIKKLSFILPKEIFLYHYL